MQRRLYLIALLAVFTAGCGSWVSNSNRPLHGPSAHDVVPSAADTKSMWMLSPGRRYELQTVSPQREVTGTLDRVTADAVILTEAAERTSVETGVPVNPKAGTRQFRNAGSETVDKRFAEITIPKAEIACIRSVPGDDRDGDAP